jgi:hypothetical protein
LLLTFVITRGFVNLEINPNIEAPIPPVFSPSPTIRPIPTPELPAPTPVPIPIPSPYPIPTLQSPSRMAAIAVQDALSALQPGQIAWNPPEQMVLGQPEIIRLIITDDLQRDLNKELDNSTVVSGVKISTFMKALVSGSAFEVAPQSPEKQALPPQSTAEWQWKVTPTDRGKQTLSLMVYARVKIPGQSSEEDVFLKSYSKELRVVVDPVNFLQSQLKWVIENLDQIMLIIVPLGGFITLRKWKLIVDLTKQGQKWLLKQLAKINRPNRK